MFTSELLVESLWLESAISFQLEHNSEHTPASWFWEWLIRGFRSRSCSGQLLYLVHRYSKLDLDLDERYECE